MGLLGDVMRKRTILCSSPRADLRNAGANRVDRETCPDGAILAHARPADLPAFCAKLIEPLNSVRS